jgi:hypothetical protein
MRYIPLFSLLLIFYINSFSQLTNEVEAALIQKHYNLKTTIDTSRINHYKKEAVLINSLILESESFLDSALIKPTLEGLDLFTLLSSTKNESELLMLVDSLDFISTEEKLFGYYRHIVGPSFVERLEKNLLKGKVLDTKSLKLYKDSDVFYFYTGLFFSVDTLLMSSYKQKDYKYCVSMSNNLPLIDSLAFFKFKSIPLESRDFIHFIKSDNPQGTCLDRMYTTYFALFNSGLNSGKSGYSFDIYHNSILSQKELFKLTTINKDKLKESYKRFVD